MNFKIVSKTIAISTIASMFLIACGGSGSGGG